MRGVTIAPFISANSASSFGGEARRDCMAIKQSKSIEGLRQRYPGGHFLILGHKVSLSFLFDRIVPSGVHRMENH